METSLMQLNSDPLLAQFTLDGLKAKRLKSTITDKTDGLKTSGTVPNFEGRETQVYVVPSSKSDTPALIVWSRPLTSRKRLSSSTCTLTPEELLGVSAAKRALSGISPWSDGREKFDLLADDCLATGDVDVATSASANSATDDVASTATGAASALSLDKTQRRASLAVSSAAQKFNSQLRQQQQQQQQRRLYQQQIVHRGGQYQSPMSFGFIGPVSDHHSPVGLPHCEVDPTADSVARSRLQNVYSRYSEKQAYKRLLKVLKRHPYLDRDSIKYNKLLLLENSLNICYRFQASLRAAGSSLQRPESLEDLAVEESHLVSAIREHVTEIPYLAAMAPKADRRAAKIQSRVKRMEKQADSCHSCHAMLCAHCLTAASAAAASSAVPASTATTTSIGGSNNSDNNNNNNCKLSVPNKVASVKTSKVSSTAGKK